MPVWIAPVATAVDAVADGMLTIGGHPNAKLTIVARGALEDGRSFRYQLNRGDYGELHTMRLTIR